MWTILVETRQSELNRQLNTTREIYDLSTVNAHKQWYKTEQEALTVAEKLAAQRGSTYYVVKAVSKSEAKPTTTKL